jgi:hypothetical protein
MQSIKPKVLFLDIIVYSLFSLPSSFTPCPLKGIQLYRI